MKKWTVTEVEHEDVASNMNESTLFLTINPNVITDVESDKKLRNVVSYMVYECLDLCLLLKQGSNIYPYEELEHYIVGDIKVDVRYEVGSKYSRNHVHIKLQTLLQDRGSIMHVDLAAVREYLKEQLGYAPYVNIRAVQNSNFNIDRYIRK